MKDAKTNGANPDDAYLSEDSQSTQGSDLDYELPIDVLLPDNTVQKTTIAANTPWSDVRTHLLMLFKLSPSSHVVDYISTSTSNKKRKASRAIGRMDVTMVTIHEKNANTKSVVTPHPASNAQETTVRLLVRLARLRQSIMRVNPDIPLSNIFDTLCEKLKLSEESKSRVEFRHPVQNEVTLNLKLTLNQYNLREVFLAEKSDSKPPNTKTAPLPHSRTKRKAPAPPRPAPPSVLPRSKSNSAPIETTPVQADVKPKPKAAKRRAAPPPPQTSTPPSDKKVDEQETATTEIDDGASPPNRNSANDKKLSNEEQDVTDALDDILNEEMNDSSHSDSESVDNPPKPPPEQHEEETERNVASVSYSIEEDTSPEEKIQHEEATTKSDDAVEVVDEKIEVATSSVVANEITQFNHEVEETENTDVKVDIAENKANAVVDDSLTHEDDVIQQLDEGVKAKVEASPGELAQDEARSSVSSKRTDSTSSGMKYGDIIVYDVGEDGNIVQDLPKSLSPAIVEEPHPDFSETFDDLPPPPPSLLDDVASPHDNAVVDPEPVHANGVVQPHSASAIHADKKDDEFDLHIAESLNIPLQAIGEKDRSDNTVVHETTTTSTSVDDAEQKDVSESDKTALEIEKLHEQIKRMRNRNSTKQKNQQSRNSWHPGSQSFTFVPNRKKSEASHADFDVAPVGGIALSNSGDFKAVHEEMKEKNDPQIIQQAPKARSTLPSYYKKFLGANAFAAKESSAK